MKEVAIAVRDVFYDVFGFTSLPDCAQHILFSDTVMTIL